MIMALWHSLSVYDLNMYADGDSSYMVALMVTLDLLCTFNVLLTIDRQQFWTTLSGPLLTTEFPLMYEATKDQKTSLWQSI